MDKHSLESLFRALNAANVRYMVMGGLAVVAHGYLRFTADVDLFIDLESTNARNAIAALKTLAYRPAVPVPFDDFANDTARASWIADKNLIVLSLNSQAHPATTVDLFAQAPVDFAQARARAFEKEIAPGVPVPFLGLADLIALKQAVGRPKDLDDVQQLQTLLCKKKVMDDSPWAQHDREQLQYWRSLALSDRLVWLEEAQSVAAALTSSPPSP